MNTIPKRKYTKSEKQKAKEQARLTAIQSKKMKYYTIEDNAAIVKSFKVICSNLIKQLD